MKLIYLTVSLLILNGCMSKSDRYSKDVLFVIGDSTSLNYMSSLHTNLDSKYDIKRPNDNCRNSYYTKMNLEFWLSQIGSEPSIIIWNNGLWDSAQVGFVSNGELPERMRTTDVEYEANLRATAARLKLTNAKIYFMTTTRVTNGSGYNEAGREDQLNTIAKSVMAELGISVIDLNQTSQNMESYKADQIHFNAEGSKILADTITDYILSH